MTISFIVTTYNIPSDMLLACINSLLGLSLSDQEREIIVVDDGSEVDVLNPLLEIENKIIYLRQPNKGLSEARNIGLRIATGDYIQFIDGDDSLLKIPYEHCLDLVRFHNPDMVLFNATDNKHQKTPFNYNGPMTGTEFMHNNNLKGSACCYIFRRSILGDLRFTPGLLHEDEEFTPLLVLRAERLFCGDCAAYYYRQRPDSITNRRDTDFLERKLEDVERIIFHLKEVADHLPRAEKLAMERRVAQLTMDYLYNIIRTTHDKKHLNAAIDRLMKRNLYPLPDKDYSKKYRLFRRLIATKVGRAMLFMMIH